jgi:hypothetical protein
MPSPDAPKRRYRNAPPSREEISELVTAIFGVQIAISETLVSLASENKEGFAEKMRALLAEMRQAQTALIHFYREE